MRRCCAGPRLGLAGWDWRRTSGWASRSAGAEVSRSGLSCQCWLQRLQYVCMGAVDLRAHRSHQPDDCQAMSCQVMPGHARSCQPDPSRSCTSAAAHCPGHIVARVKSAAHKHAGLGSKGLRPTLIAMPTGYGVGETFEDSVEDDDVPSESKLVTERYAPALAEYCRKAEKNTHIMARGKSAARKHTGLGSKAKNQSLAVHPTGPPDAASRPRNSAFARRLRGNPNDQPQLNINALQEAHVESLACVQ